MKNLKRIFGYLFVAILATLFIGCNSSQPNSPEVFVSKQLRIEKIEFNLTEYHKSEIVYHTKN